MSINATLLAAVSKAQAGKREVRQQLQGVYITETQIAATDGSIVTVAENSGGVSGFVGQGISKGIIIPVSKKAVAACSGKGAMSVSVEVKAVDNSSCYEGTLCVFEHGRALCIEPVEDLAGPYPDYARIIEGKDFSIFDSSRPCFSVEVHAVLVATAKVLGVSGYTISGPSDSVNLVCYADRDDIFSVIMPVLRSDYHPFVPAWFGEVRGKN